MALVLERAFIKGQDVQYVLKNPKRRPEVLHDLYEYALNNISDNNLGEVWMANDSSGKCIGCAIWAKSGTESKVDPVTLETQKAKAEQARSELKRKLNNSEWMRREKMHRYLDKTHDAIFEKVKGPCWELWLIGVTPGAQSKGIGAALMEPVMRRAKNNGELCYLEVFVPNDILEAFYSRKSFLPAAEGAVASSGPHYRTKLNIGDLERLYPDECTYETLFEEAFERLQRADKRKHNTPLHLLEGVIKAGSGHGDRPDKSEQQKAQQGAPKNKVKT